jgi:predicted O-methyltransferase YrrM
MAKWFMPSPRGELRPVPWLAPGVITYLEGIIQPDWEIIEHGSGGSTLWFAERVKHVTAFEDDPDWMAIVGERAPDNVLVSGMPRGAVLGLNKKDLLLIDGEPVKERAWWVEYAPEMVKPGGWIVLDNANRPEYKAERERLGEIAELVDRFDSNEGGTQYLVTEFYRLPAAQEEPKKKGGKRASRK